MNIDQEKVNYSYEDPVNATWADTFEEYAHSVTFYPEVLGPRSAFEADHGSPFVTTPFLFEDYAEYRRHEDARVVIRREHWPKVERASIHFERRQWELFEKELETLVAPTDGDPGKGRIHRMFNAITLALQWFTLDFRNEIWKPAKEAFERAKTTAGQPLEAFANTYRDSGRLISLWRQVTSVNTEIVATYPTWMPILQLKYWAETPPDLHTLVVSDKRFDELKHLYLAAFETTAKLSVIALGADLLAAGSDLSIPGTQRSLSIWDFEQTDNAKKAPYLEAREGTRFLARYLTTKLRNGIGHNAAHYDPATDEVVCLSARRNTLREWRLSYTDFCYQLLHQISVLMYAETYLFNTLLIAQDLAAPNREA